MLTHRGAKTKVRDVSLDMMVDKLGGQHMNTEQEKIDFINARMNEENFPARVGQDKWQGLIIRYDQWIRQRHIPASKYVTIDDLKKITHLV